MLSDREYRYWTTQNGDRQYCWLVLEQLDELVSCNDEYTLTGPDGKTATFVAEKEADEADAAVKDADEQDQGIPNLWPKLGIPLSQAKLRYVYLVDFSDTRIVTIVQDDQYFYLLDITTEDKTITRVTYRETLSKLVAALAGKLRKQLNLKLRSKAKLKKTQISNLKGVVPVDFIGKSSTEQVQLFRKYAGQSKKNLDLSGLLFLEEEVILQAGDGSPFRHEEVTLYQNHRLTDFNWMSRFPDMNILSIWYNSHIKDAAIDNLARNGTKLEILEFHNCNRLTGRIMIPISTMPMLDKLIIDNQKCQLHEELQETVISNKEWEELENNSLTLLFINSLNLTLDFINFVVMSFKAITTFYMDEAVLAKLEKNSSSGGKDKEDPILFRSIQNQKQGFKRFRDVKIYDLVKHKGACTISDSMRRVIEQQTPGYFEREAARRQAAAT